VRSFAAGASPFGLQPAAADTPASTAGPEAAAAVAVATRWAAAFTAGDDRWRQLTTLPLASRLAGDSPEWGGALVEWASPAAVTATQARVYLYVTAVVGGVDVAASYDCELAVTGAGWQVVGVLG
jgi:hypothetical protein